ncbi:App1 family protein [Desulfobacula sp.]|uniref:App1 family protein n=1 Tax=Desulfobacula sp. TaxID=2593537 RepID=UPI00260263CD|nr:App1 family protein [Desulfobacula sp.]
MITTTGTIYTHFWTLIANGSMQATFDQKMAQIRTLLKHFPERKFILIGDNGEKDPEVYRRIQKAFPYQIQEIRIRVVADTKDNPGRLDRMTRIPPEKEDGETCSEFINTF